MTPVGDLIRFWTNYRDSWPRSFNGVPMIDPKQIERENTLMSAFIRDLRMLESRLAADAVDPVERPKGAIE